MKRLTILAFCLIAISLGFSSCEKEYTCTCITTDTSGMFETSKSSKPIPSAKKSDAEDICSSTSTTFDTLETVCSLE